METRIYIQRKGVRERGETLRGSVNRRNGLRGDEEEEDEEDEDTLRVW